MANQDWLLSEEEIKAIDNQILFDPAWKDMIKHERYDDPFNPSYFYERKILLKAQLARCDPLIRADEAKKYEGWKSPEEIGQIRKDAYKLGVDHQNELNKLDCENERAKTLKEVGELLDREIMHTDNRVTKLWVLADIIKALKQGIMYKE